MKTRSVSGVMVAGSLLLALILATAAGAAPVAVRAGAVMQPMGVVRTGPMTAVRAAPVMGSAFGTQVPRPLTTGLPGAGFATGTPFVTPRLMRFGSVFVPQVPRPLTPAFVSPQLRMGPLSRPNPSGVLPEVLPTSAPMVRSEFSTTASAAAAAQATQLTAVQAFAQTTVAGAAGEAVTPLDAFPLPAEAAAVGELPGGLDQGLLSAEAIAAGELPEGLDPGLVPSGTAGTFATETPALPSAEELMALPGGGIIVLPEAGVVPLDVLPVLPQVTFAPTPTGIVDPALGQVLP